MPKRCFRHHILLFCHCYHYYHYQHTQRQNILRGYGCINKQNLPQRSSEMSPVRMEQLTGLKLEALRPSDRPFFWRVGGIALCGIQYLIGEALGIDPLTTTIPITFAGLAADQVCMHHIYVYIYIYIYYVH